MVNACPVCLGRYAIPAKVQRAPTRATFLIDCQTCGRFGVTEEVIEDYLSSDRQNALTDLQRAATSHFVRRFNARAESKPVIVDGALFEGFFKSGCRLPTKPSQTLNALALVCQTCEQTGERYSGDTAADFARVGCANPWRYCDLLKEMIESGLLRGEARHMTGRHSHAVTVEPTLVGWAKHENDAKGHEQLPYGFVARQFQDQRLDTLLGKFAGPALKDGLGCELKDMRELARAGVIDNIMRESIRRARFVLSDLTTDNSGAYWEAGYAEGLGKPVLYLCEKAKFEEFKTHFDTNHCTTLLWSDGEELRFCEDLIATLRRTLSEP